MSSGREVSAAGGDAKDVRGRPRRKVLRWILLGMLLLLAARAGLDAALPSLAEQLLARAGVEAEVGEIELELTRGRVRLHHVVLREPAESRPPGANEDPWLAIGQAIVHVDVGALLSGRLVVDRVGLYALDVLIEREADGTWVLGRMFAPENPRPRKPRATPRPLDLGVPVEVREVRVLGGRVRYLDAVLGSPMDVAGTLNLVAFDVGSAEREARVELSVTRSEHLDQLLLEAHGPSAGPALDLSFDLEIRRLSSAPLKRLMRPIRIEAPEEVANLASAGAVRLIPYPTGGMRLEIDVQDFGVTCGAGERVELGEYGMRLAIPARAPTTFESLRLAGLRGAIAYGPEGVLSAAGFRYHLPRSGNADGRGTPALPDLDFEDLEVTLSDATFDPPHRLDVAIARAHLSREAVDGGTPYDLALDLHAPGLAEALEVRGTWSPGGSETSVSLSLDAAGIDTLPLEPYLRAAGARLRASDVDATADANLVVREGDAGIELDLDVTDLELLQSGELQLAANAVRLRAGSAGPPVDSIELEAPSLRLIHEPSGSWSFGGLHLVPAEASSEDDAGDGEDRDWWDLRPLQSLLEAMVGGMPHHARIDSGRVLWSDRSGATPVELEARVAGTIDPGDGGDGTRSVELSGSIEGALGELRLTGDLARSPGRGALQADLEMSGLRTSPFRSYLPSWGARVLEEGRMGLALQLDLDALEDGGRRASLAVGGAHLGEADAEPDVAFESLLFTVEQPSLDVVKIEELSLEGLRVVARYAGPERRVAGREFRRQRPDSGEGLDPLGEPLQGPVGSIEDLPEALRLPRIELDSIEIDLERLEVIDGLHPRAEPLEIALRIANERAGVLIDPTESEGEPLELRLEGAVRPIAESLEATAQVSAFRSSPSLRLDLRVDGLSPAGLGRSRPVLARRLGAGKLEGGSLTAGLRAEIRTRRLDMLDLGLGRGFGFDAFLENLELRGPEGKEPLASLELVHLDVERYSPRSGSLHVRSLEAYNPAGDIHFTEGGDVEALGLLLLSADGEQDDPSRALVAEATHAPAEPAEDDGRDPRDEGAGNPRRLVRIDRLVLTGIDVELLYETVEPPVRLPLVDLDLEVLRLGNYYRRDGRPIKMRGYLGGGKVDLPRHEGHNVLRSTLGKARSVVPGRNDVDLEERPAFEQLAVAANLALTPELDGWIRIRLESLELVPFASIAALQGVLIADGVVDSAVELRFEPGGLSTTSYTTLGHLQVSESEDGPIRSALGLPIPLNSAIFLLQDENGEVHLDLEFEVPPEGMTADNVSKKGLDALGQLVRRALAGSPKRLTGAVTDIARFGGNALVRAGRLVRLDAVLPVLRYREPQRQVEAQDLVFAPAAMEPDRAQQQRIEKMIERFVEDDQIQLVLEHHLGAADVERLTIVANPGENACRELAGRRTRQMDELIDRRSAALSEVHEAVDEHRFGDARQLEDHVRAIDREIGLTERSLDSLLDMLRSDSDRRDDLRMRAAAHDLAEMRLQLLLQQYLANAPPGARDRARVMRPRLHSESGRDQGVVHAVLRMRR